MCHENLWDHRTQKSSLDGRYASTSVRSRAISPGRGCLTVTFVFLITSNLQEYQSAIFNKRNRNEVVRQRT